MGERELKASEIIDVFHSGGVFEMPIKGKLLDTAKGFLAESEHRPTAPRLAASVMLVRDASANTVSGSAPSGAVDAALHDDTHVPQITTSSLFVEGDRSAVEVFMLQRAETMVFVPRAAVFPGGRVDSSDSDTQLVWAGPSPAEWADRMHCDEETARSVVVAAAREVFEESGVLLAGYDRDSTVENLNDPSFVHARKSLVHHEKSFSEVLHEHDLIFRSDLLGLRSHWLTPEFEPRRYDTYFFAALMPEGQKADGSTSEATTAAWVDPRWIFDQVGDNHALLLPPTRYNLAQIAQARCARDFVAENPRVERITPKLHVKENGVIVLSCLLP